MDWWEVGYYTGESCSHCTRERVMRVDAPDGSEHRVCEKCEWDQDAADFASTLVFPSPPSVPEE